jgi:hypothetical protein
MGLLSHIHSPFRSRIIAQFSNSAQLAAPVHCLVLSVESCREVSLDRSWLPAWFINRLTIGRLPSLGWKNQFQAVGLWQEYVRWIVVGLCTLEAHLELPRLFGAVKHQNGASLRDVEEGLQGLIGRSHFVGS